MALATVQAAGASDLCGRSPETGLSADGADRVVMKGV